VAFALALGFVCVSSLVRVAARSDVVSGPLTGHARVIDGDTIVIGETRVRLEGIDAPESAQTCQRKWFGSWACGTAATVALSDMIGGKPVSCESHGLDKYGRTLGTCFVEGRDINAQMVRRGYAWAFIKYSTSYVRQEEAAKAEGLGIWQGPSQPAWEFRAGRWAAVEPATPQGCAIKGNVTKHGRIYHMPWSPWYAQIRMEPDKGKRWFCTEAEAVAAGWRPVAAH
jgi:endonuclease YncB( thermonuclease family)